MTVNIGTVDRLLRAAVGALLLVLALTSLAGSAAVIAAVIGVVLLATAGLRFCPAYRLLGIQTCPR